MMSFAIMRICKIKAVSTFSAIERHARQRSRIPHRAHPELSANNREFLSKMIDPSVRLVDRWRNRTAGMKVRKNAVLAYEIVMAYSPEAVLDVVDWCRSNLRWLSKTFGVGNTIMARLDCDESTPHMHAVVVPIVDGRLNARHYTGGRMALSQLQDSYADAVACHGLDRGVIGSKKRHTPVKEHWVDFQKEVAEIERMVFGDDRCESI